MTCCDRPIFAQVRNVDSFASALAERRPCALWAGQQRLRTALTDTGNVMGHG